jgi:arsenate reductase
MAASLSVRVFGALAHPARLAVFRVLAQHGAAGLPAGRLAARTTLPPSTLSFHLRDLAAAGLVVATRRGREIHYAADGGTLQQALWFLGEECCQGRRDLCASPTARIEAGRRPTAPTRPGVLFVCSHNAARSQLAEALLRHRTGDRFEVQSAGLRPTTVHPLTATVLAEVGVPSDGCTSKDLGSVLGKRPYEHAFVLCAEAQQDCPQRVPFAAATEYWPFDDPTAVPPRRQLAAFRAVRDAIASRLTAWLHEPPPPRRRRRAATA